MAKTRKSTARATEDDVVANWIGIGAGVGAAFGVIYGNIALGVGFGAALGAAIGGLEQASAAKRDRSPDVAPPE